MDSTEKERIDNALNILNENYHQMNSQQKLSVSLLKTMAETINKTFVQITSEVQLTNKYTNELLNEIEEIKYYNKIQNIISLIENNIKIVNTLFDNLQNTILFAQSKTVHPFSLPIKALNKIYSTLTNLYGEQQLLHFTNHFNYYQLLRIEIHIDEAAIVFKIDFPIMFPTLFAFYHVYPVPFHNQLILLPETYLLQAKDEYVTLEKKCPKIEDMHVCTGEIKHQDLDVCILNLFRNQDKHCDKVAVQQNISIVKQVENSDLLLLTNKKVNVYFKCNEIGFVEINENTLIKLPPNCSITINKKTFEVLNNSIPEDVYHLPDLTSSDSEIQENHLKLNFTEVHLDNFDRIQKDIKHLESEPFHPHIHSSVNSILIIIFVLTFICISIMYKYIKFCEKKNKKVSSETVLENLKDPQEPF